MMSKTNGNYILGLEAGLAGGSVSIFKGDICIDSCEGEKDLFRSEDLLVLVEEILAANDLKKSEIDSIIVSDGPGSLTGVRIGLATAKGLSDALAIPLHGFSILDALAVSADVRGEITAAVFTEKSGLYLRDYKCGDGSCSPASEIVQERDVPGFLEKLEHAADGNKNFVLHMDLDVWSKREFNRSILGKPYITVIRGHYAALLITAGTRLIMSKK